jgi:ribosomal protein L24
MTVKRDFKRRVRQRQARTGEAYVTARRHVLAARQDASAGADDEPTDAMAAALDDDVPAATVPGPADVGRDDPGAADAAGGPPEAPIALATGDRVEVVDGPFAGHAGTIDEVKPHERRLRVAVAIGGRTTSVELDFAQVEPAEAMAVQAEQPLIDRAISARATPVAAVAARAVVPVVELVDVSEEAKRVGVLCRAVMSSALAARAEPAEVLSRLRNLLIETAGDPQMLRFSQAALAGYAPPPVVPREPPLGSFEQQRRFVQRAQAGLGGVSDDGSLLAFHVAGRAGLALVCCSLSWREPLIVLQTTEDFTADIDAIKGRIAAEPWQQLAQRLVVELAVPRAPVRALFVIHDGRRHPITQSEFVIGRHRETVHLAIKDGLVSRHHAAVIRRDGAFYIKDLESAHGIHYKGMRIDNKRIDEGDVIRIGDHELLFTFLPED